MSNSYYTPTGVPATQSSGLSSQIRGEFQLIEAGFDDVEARLSIVNFISVKDAPYNAVGNGSTDDTAAIQACITANPGKTIFFPPGSYKVTGTLTISTDKTKLYGNNDVSIIQHTANIDTVVFKPTTAGVTSAFLNFPAIIGITVTHTSAVAAVAVSGAAVKFIQCNVYRADQVVVNDAFEGITVMGGQYGSLDNVTLFASQGSYAGDGTALLHFRQAPYGSGLYQPCYTTEVSNFRTSASKLRDAIVRIYNGDGISFSQGYLANGKNSLVLLKAERDNGYISGVGFTNTYIDCINEVSGTVNGVVIPDDGYANTTVYDVTIGDGCTIGNGPGTGVLSRKANVFNLRIGGRILNFPTGLAVDVEGDSTKTDVNVTADIQRCLAGGVRVENARTLRVSAQFKSLGVGALITEGTIGQGTITGNNHASGNTVPDWVDSATWTNGVSCAGNTSVYRGTDSWVGLRTSNVSVANSNTLDHYVEGTFTPTITLGGAAVGITYATQYGSYTRIGNRVYFSLTVVLTSKGSSTGECIIGGLPITSSESQSSPAAVYANNLSTGISNGLVGVVFTGSTSMAISKVDAGFAIRLTDADLTNTSDLRVSGVYRV